MKQLYLLLILVVFNFRLYAQHIVRYDLYVKDTIVNFTGKEKRAIAVNGQIPMPTLNFTEGDTAEIHVHNQLKESTSLHWHGLHLPNQEDGVPYLTQMPIEAGATYIYRFPLIQNGTHWYHSHSGFQEQIGMYGSFIIHKKQNDTTFRKGIDDLPTLPIIISDWTDYKPEEVQRMLGNASDWFAIKKGTTQSYTEAIREGHFKTKIINEWKRMLAMDVSDVYYNKFLINGKEKKQFPQFKAGDKVRLQISNAGASSYFWLTYSGGKIMVVANDGNDVEPVEVDRLIIAVSETYDLIVTIPENNKSYQFLATSEDRTGSASLYLGNGIEENATPLPKLKYFEGMKMMNGMMKMNGSMHDMDMKMSLQQMDMNNVMYPEIDKNNTDNMHMMNMNKSVDHHTQHDQHAMHSSKIITLNYGMLKATHPTTLTDSMPIKELSFELTGNMNRYVWSMNNKVLSEVDKIPVKKGTILRITLYNNSMMRHPMHLHGFDFRLLNDNGEYSPLKNVVDLMPMEKNVIEFAANVEGDWFFHCHILYHMMAGMNRVLSIGTLNNPLLPNKERAYDKLQKESNMKHFMIKNDFATNGNDGMASLQNARWNLNAEWRIGYNNIHGYEIETHLGRYVDKMQWFMPFIGFDWQYRKLSKQVIEKNIFGQKNNRSTRALFSVGIAYTLPMLAIIQAEVYHDGTVKATLKREDITISKRIRSSLMINTDKEYSVGLLYILTRNIGLSTHYDSDMGWGIGLNVQY